jgi:hypothetical protein
LRILPCRLYRSEDIFNKDTLVEINQFETFN